MSGSSAASDGDAQLVTDHHMAVRLQACYTDADFDAERSYWAEWLNTRQPPVRHSESYIEMLEQLIEQRRNQLRELGGAASQQIQTSFIVTGSLRGTQWLAKWVPAGQGAVSSAGPATVTNSWEVTWSRMTRSMPFAPDWDGQADPQRWTTILQPFVEELFGDK